MAMNGNEPGLASAKREVAARAVRLTNEASAVLQELAEYEPNTAFALASNLFDTVSEKTKLILNDDPSQAEEAKSQLSVEQGGVSTSERFDLAPDTGEIKSYLKPSEINQRSILNRKLRRTMYDDIVLLLLLANEGRDLVATDLKNEFARLQIKIGSTTLLSRVARLREDKAIESVIVTRAGFYRLTMGGRKVALEAKRKRWSSQLQAG
jgi:hypothetical protein